MVMNWMEKVIITLLAHMYLVMNTTPSYALPESWLNGETLDEGRSSSDRYSLENYIELLSSILMKPWTFGVSPLVYIENEIDQVMKNEEADIYSESTNVSQDKRSKHHRKFPLKYQNKYLRYDAENRYMCLPSRKEVAKLLVALQQTKHGKRGHKINFCNRKRPALTLFSNIRFYGK